MGLCFTFGVIVDHGVIDFLFSHPAGSIPASSLYGLGEVYGTLSVTMLNLGMAISGGRDWKEVMEPLDALPAIYSISVLVFVSTAIFGALNIVTGMFVDFAFEVTHNQKKEQIRKKLMEHQEWERSIQEMFREADEDNSGFLSWDEFEVYMEHPLVIAFFQSLEIDVSEATGLFALLDLDGNGEVSADDFVKGCAQLKGEAKSLDLATMRYEFLRFAHRSRKSMDHLKWQVETTHSTLTDLVDNLDFDFSQTPRGSPRSEFVDTHTV